MFLLGYELLGARHTTVERYCYRVTPFYVGGKVNSQKLGRKTMAPVLAGRTILETFRFTFCTGKELRFSLRLSFFGL